MRLDLCALGDLTVWKPQLHQFNRLQVVKDNEQAAWWAITEAFADDTKIGGGAGSMEEDILKTNAKSQLRFQYYGQVVIISLLLNLLQKGKFRTDLRKMRIHMGDPQAVRKCV
ncbi:hypothetical protein scyTo_0006602 [Scyliorhinus torazame]|uniref:Uncharacterized protein n=1 Tax=Scyliorhinus torazame TaxID=75743 RepID=A0A401PIW2_SCYTO|nr:hypothetical protein [Scyliorhinus torazame]